MASGLSNRYDEYYIECDEYALCNITLRYIDTVFLGRRNHHNHFDAQFEKNLVHYIKCGCLLLNE